MINPVHLRTLVAVVRLGSFAEAARHLGYTSSAVSQQISGLERATHLQLFERDAQSIRPTPAARMLVERSAESLAALDALQSDVAGLADGQIARLRLGSFPTASEAVLPHALARLAVTHPGVHISLDEDEPASLVAGMHAGELDMALVYEYDLVPHRWMSDLVHVPLLREEILLLAPPGRPPSTEGGLASLSDARWISTREHTAAVTFLRRACADAGFDPIMPLRSNDYDVVRGLVGAGLGIALVPALSMVGTPDVEVHTLPGLAVSRHVSVVQLASANHPAIGVVISALHDAARETARRHPHVHTPAASTARR